MVLPQQTRAGDCVLEVVAVTVGEVELLHVANNGVHNPSLPTAIVSGCGMISYFRQYGAFASMSFQLAPVCKYLFYDIVVAGLAFLHVWIDIPFEGI